MSGEFKLRDVLGYGDLPEQIAEQMRRFPHGAEQIGALIVNGADLALQGRWAGEPRPHAWHPPWSDDAPLLSCCDPKAVMEAVPHRRGCRARRWQPRVGHRMAACTPLASYRP